MKTNHAAQVIFNSTNLIMPHKFIKNKFVQEFMAISLLNFGCQHRYLRGQVNTPLIKNKYQTVENENGCNLVITGMKQAKC